MELMINSKNTYSLRFLFFILIISSTLFFDSYFGFNGLVPVGIVCSFFIAFFLGVIKVRLSDCIVVSFFIFCALGTLVFTFRYWNSDFSQIKNFSFLVLGVLTYLLAKTIINKLYAKEIVDIVNAVILLHIIVFMAQLFFYYILNYDLNIGLMLGGSGHRAFTEGGVYRPTGIFDEPAIYSVFCSGLVLMRLFYHKKIDWIVLLSLLSILLTLSFVGFILAGSILIIYASWKLKFLLTVVFLFIVVLVFSPVFEGNYIVNRLDMLLVGEDASTNSKVLVISDFFSTDQLFNFGYGYIGLRDWTPTYYDAIYDLTFYVTLLIEFGFYLGTIFLIIFIISIFFIKRPVADVLSFLILLVKLTATHFPFLWVVFAFFFSKSNTEKN